MTYEMKPVAGKNVLFVMAADAEYGVFLRTRISPLMTGVGPVEAAIVLTRELARLASHDDLPTADEVEDVFQRLYAVARDAPFEVKTTEGHHYRRIVVQHEQSAGRMARRAPLGIRDGRGVAFVSHIGEISPSGFLPVVAGNVRTDSLAAVYRSHPLFVNLRDSNRLLGKCGRCEFKDLCGGSRARSLAVAGDVFAEEPLCNYQPGG